jgi:hypothetical protein
MYVTRVNTRHLTLCAISRVTKQQVKEASCTNIRRDYLGDALGRVAL